MDFRILNWNIGGAKYLELKEEERKIFRRELNRELMLLIQKHKPHVVTLQEVVRYGTSNQNAVDIIDSIDDYMYCSIPLIDTDLLSSKAKWHKVKEMGGWEGEPYFAQGNAFLFHKLVPHFPVWALPANTKTYDHSRHFIEQVHLESGLYFGDRNTEPRAALVAHFVFDPDKSVGKPLDIFVVNIHLTTLMMEREGIPRIDLQAAEMRRQQLEVLFCGIVSRYNIWKQEDYPERGKIHPPEEGETYTRYQPVWVLAGDFNFTPNSMEYDMIQKMNFIDVVPTKGIGTKAKGRGATATLTVDYIFAGPQFISLDPVITEHAIKKNGSPDYTVKVSDHYPIFATIPLAIRALDEKELISIL